MAKLLYQISIRNLLLIIFTFIFLSCGDSNDSSTDTVVLKSQGTRILGMDVKEIPSVPYATAYSEAMSIGVREVSISLDWSLLEPSVGNYDNTFPVIIDSFYPTQTGDIALILRPLDTPGPSLPSELIGLSYDDPAVIAAFENFLENLHNQLPTLKASGKLKWIHIGNEINAYLDNNSTRWSQWQTFFQAAKTKVHILWGTNVKVSSIIEFSVLNDTDQLNLYTNLLPYLDNAVLTYYPLKSDFTMRPVSTIETDFKHIVDTIPSKTIFLQECGYPSSIDNNSSQTQQADFISAVFKSWDKHINRIGIIDFSWQYDASPSTVDQWMIDYNMTGHPNESAFRAYLGTLGLNNFDSTEKAAMQELRDELQARSWEQ